MQQKSIFISYRRKEGLREARALFERLSREFGSNKVFIDLEGIQPGEDFITLLENLLSNCAVLLVLIGPGWASGTRGDGRRRLDDESDFVRTEISAALKRGVRVIPVCFDGAEMPSEMELPEELRALVRRQSVVLDFNRFENDIRPLIDAIRATLAAVPPVALTRPPEAELQPVGLGTRAKPHRGFAFLTILAALALAAVALLPQWFQSPSLRQSVVQALVDSQRLTTAGGQALLGSETAFAEIAAAATGLKSGFDDIDKASMSSGLRETITSLQPIVERSLKNEALIASQQKALTRLGSVNLAMKRLSPDLLESVDAVNSLQLQRGASVGELSVTTQLAMLTQRIPKSVSEIAPGRIDPDTVFLLGKDLKSFQLLGQALLNGSQELRLPGTKNPELRERIETVLKQFERMREECAVVLENLQGLVDAHKAHNQLVNDAAPLRNGFEQLRQQADAGPDRKGWAMAFGAALVTGVAGWTGLFGALARRRVKAA